MLLPNSPYQYHSRRTVAAIFVVGIQQMFGTGSRQKSLYRYDYPELHYMVALFHSTIFLKKKLPYQG